MPYLDDFNSTPSMSISKKSEIPGSETTIRTSQTSTNETSTNEIKLPPPKRANLNKSFEKIIETTKTKRAYTNRSTSLKKSISKPKRKYTKRAASAKIMKNNNNNNKKKNFNNLNVNISLRQIPVASTKKSVAFKSTPVSSTQILITSTEAIYLKVFL